LTSMSPAINDRRHRPGSSAQATVELAMILPVLLLVTAAVCQVAMGLNCYLIVMGASREGARRCAETNDTTAARDAALKASSGLPGEKPVIDVSFPEGRGRGKPARVTVTYKMPFLLPGLDRLVPRASFAASTCMALERAQ